MNAVSEPDRKQKHVLICNERILFRYGVDRVLVETARMFVEAGWRATFACIRCDRDVVKGITPHLFVPKPKNGGDLYDYESDCARFLEESWLRITERGPVDAIISGGWPFFHVAALGERRGVPTIFIDAGAVPHDGLDESQAATQRAVRRLRAACLSHFDLILPISDFIRESQTIPDRGSDLGVEVVRLGVDHLAGKVFSPASASLAREEDFLIERLERLVARQIPLVLSLGRFEQTGYKNSQASFQLLGELLKRARDLDQKDVRLLLLGRAEEVSVPADLEAYVICLGSPSDEGLIRIMKLASVGFSPSLWEGFNLPIGEMQILDKPVFAFNVGAHPEVILHPWFLCANVVEAAHKIREAIADRLPEGVFDAQKRASYRETFAWKNTLAAYFKHTTRAIAFTKAKKPKSKALLVDVSNSSRDTANSGVVRVTRRLSAQLQRLGDFLLLFVYWDSASQTYRFVKGEREKLLASYSGPRTGFGLLSGRGVEITPERVLHHMPYQFAEATLLLAEVVMDGEANNRIDWASRNGLSTAAILYDLIPIEHPNLCSAELCENFPKYIEALARTDKVIAISQYSLDCFSNYLQRRKLQAPKGMHVAWLPGQLGAAPRVTGCATPGASEAVSIVCVSTIEPRKNHKTLLAAYAQFRRANPDLNARLTLIGNLYHGAEELAAKVRNAVAEDATIVWRGAISDDDLIAEMRTAAFTVYPSLVEGFGLPVLESLWMGKPCVCHNGGVMAELAVGGGCVTVDMGDVDALARTIENLVKNGELRARLAEEAQSREIAVWSDYAKDVSALLGGNASSDAASDEQSVESLELTGNALFRAAIEREAYFVRHRLSGSGILSAEAAAAEIVFETEDDVLIWRAGAHSTAAPSQSQASAALSSGESLSEAAQATGVAGNGAGARRPKGVAAWFTRIVGGGALNVRQVQNSDLFDAEWYLKTYPDVRAVGVDPLKHFVKHGHMERRSPGPRFDSQKYVSENPGLDLAGLSPFEHYLKHGRR